MKMTEKWLSRNLKPPPVYHARVSNGQFKKGCLLETENGLSELAQVLSLDEVLGTEHYSLRRLLYKVHNQQRREKAFMYLQLINKCVRRYLELRLPELVEVLGSELNRLRMSADEEKYYPSQQTLQYHAVVLMQAAGLLAQILTYCLQAYVPMRQQMAKGHFLDKNLVYLGMISRFWTTSRCIMVGLQTAYGILLKELPDFPANPLSWLGQEKLPSDLRNWLSANWSVVKSPYQSVSSSIHPKSMNNSSPSPQNTEKLQPFQAEEDLGEAVENLKSPSDSQPTGDLHETSYFFTVDFAMLTGYLDEAVTPDDIVKMAKMLKAVLLCLPHHVWVNLQDRKKDLRQLNTVTKRQIRLRGQNGEHHRALIRKCLEQTALALKNVICELDQRNAASVTYLLEHFMWKPKGEMSLLQNQDENTSVSFGPVAIIFKGKTSSSLCQKLSKIADAAIKRQTVADIREAFSTSTNKAAAVIKPSGNSAKVSEAVGNEEAPSGSQLTQALGETSYFFSADFTMLTDYCEQAVTVTDIVKMAKMLKWMFKSLRLHVEMNKQCRRIWAQLKTLSKRKIKKQKVEQSQASIKKCIELMALASNNVMCEVDKKNAGKIVPLLVKFLWMPKKELSVLQKQDENTSVSFGPTTVIFKGKTSKSLYQKLSKISDATIRRQTVGDIIHKAFSKQTNKAAAVIEPSENSTTCTVSEAVGNVKALSGSLSTQDLKKTSYFFSVDFTMLTGYCDEAVTVRDIVAIAKMLKVIFMCLRLHVGENRQEKILGRLKTVTTRKILKGQKVNQPRALIRQCIQLMALASNDVICEVDKVNAIQIIRLLENFLWMPKGELSVNQNQGENASVSFGPATIIFKGKTSTSLCRKLSKIADATMERHERIVAFRDIIHTAFRKTTVKNKKSISSRRAMERKLWKKQHPTRKQIQEKTLRKLKQSPSKTKARRKKRNGRCM